MSPDELDTVLRYMKAHELSVPSFRYIFILWFIIVGLGILLGLERALGIFERTIVGAMWTKWAARHRVVKIGSKAAEQRARSSAIEPGARAIQAARRRVFTFMDLGRMAVLVMFSLVLLCLTFIGADYINPDAAMFASPSFADARDREANKAQQRRGSLQWGQGSYKEVLFESPRYTLPYHTWWTMGDRTGDICNALTPFIVLIALKQTPFAFASIPIFGGFSIDLLHYLHRWGGRAIWVYATAHAITWSIQLANDELNGHNLWHYMVDVPRFRWAWVAYVFLTLLIILSLNPVRRRQYEVFYILHVVCSLGFIIATWVHHPQIGWWMLAALILWGGERAIRLVKVVWVNYSRRPLTEQRALAAPSTTSLVPQDPASMLADDSSIMSKEANASLSMWPDSSNMSLAQPMSLSQPYVPNSIRPVISWDLSQHLYPGFAFVQPLAGETLRFVLRTAYPLSWTAGQWVYLRLPQLSWIQSHPFTIASVHCMQESSQPATHGSDQLVMLLIRARGGLTRQLWDYVRSACEHSNSMHLQGKQRRMNFSMFPALNGEHVPAHVNGVYLRSIVDGPFGSSARIDWGAYSNALVVCGGSGVSFGISVLEHLCRQVARVRSGEEVKSRFGRPFLLRRVRFVWVLREFAHIQWVASTLRYCLELLPPGALRVQMFVTCINERQVRPGSARPPQQQQRPDAQVQAPQADILPMPADPESHVDAPPSAAALFTRGQEWDDLQLTINDITQFDEERDTVSPLDRTMNERIMRQGKTRRANTRRRQTQKHDAEAARRRIAERHSQASLRSVESGIGWQGHADQQARTDLPTPSEHPMRASEDTVADSVVETPAIVYDEPLSDYFSLPRSTYAQAAPRTDTIQLDTLETRPGTAGSTATRPGTSASQKSLDSDRGRSIAIPEVNLEPQEARDLEIVSELARAGYPKLDEIVAEEMNNASGRLIAAGCGPPGLSALLRTVVSRAVDVSKVWHGDLSGHATVYTESFES